MTRKLKKMFGRIKTAWKALTGKSDHVIHFGMDIKRCDDCRRDALDVAGCYFCEDVGVTQVAPRSPWVPGLGVLDAKYCFNCGKRLLFKPDDRETRK